MEAAESPNRPPEPGKTPDYERVRVDMTLPVPVGLWVKRQAAERFQTTSGYVRSIVVAMYRRDQGTP